MLLAKSYKLRCFVRHHHNMRKEDKKTTLTLIELSAAELIKIGSLAKK
jgi:hypothetical protein